VRIRLRPGRNVGHRAGDLLDQRAVRQPAPLLALGIAVERVRLAEDQVHGDGGQVERHAPCIPPHINVNREQTRPAERGGAAVGVGRRIHVDVLPEGQLGVVIVDVDAVAAGGIGRDGMAAVGLHHARHEAARAGAHGKEPLLRIAAEPVELVYRFIQELGAGLHPVVLADFGPEVAGLGRAKELAPRAIVPLGGRAAVLDACREEGVAAVLVNRQVPVRQQQARGRHAHAASSTRVDPDLEDRIPEGPVDRVGYMREAKPQRPHTDIGVVAVHGQELVKRRALILVLEAEAVDRRVFRLPQPERAGHAETVEVVRALPGVLHHPSPVAAQGTHRRPAALLGHASV